MKLNWLLILLALNLPALASALGSQPTLVLQVYFDSPFAQTETETMVREADRLLRPNSSGGTWLEPVYAAPFRPSQPIECYRGADGLRRLRTEALSAQNLPRHPRIVMVVPAEYAGQASLGTVGYDLVRDRQAEWYATTSWIRPHNSPAGWGRVLAHELGHNFGFWHAHGNCCSDSGDLMGSDSGNLFSAAWRVQAGWLKPASIATVRETGTFRLEAAEGNAGTQALFLPTGGGEGFWLEYRAASDEVQIRHKRSGSVGTSRLDNLTAEGAQLERYRLRLQPQQGGGVTVQVVVPDGATALK